MSNPSEVFVNKVLCLTCGIPVLPEHAAPAGVCLACQGNVRAANSILALDQPKLPARGFKEALAEVRRHGRPLVIDSVEAIMDGLDGAVAFGTRIADDLKALRGEHLPEEMRTTFDLDMKSLKGMYELIVRMQSDRDKMVGETGDPLADMSDDDLMVIASQGALVRLEVDAEFRKTILAELVRLDPQAVVTAAGDALDAIEAGPRVEIIG